MRHLFRGAVVSAAAVLLSVGLAPAALAADSDCNLSIADVSQAEGDDGTTPMTFTVTATTTVTDACDGVQVRYAFTGGSAQWDEDFTATDDSADPFGTGTTQTRTFDASVIGDTEVESDEDFSVDVTVSDANEKVVLPAGTLTATGTITNDDAPPPGLAPGATLSRSPVSGPGGTVINVSGTACTNTLVEVFLIGQQGEMGGLASDVKEVTVGGDGTWATTLTVKDGMDPDAEYSVNAKCGDDFYPRQSFDLTGSTGFSGYRLAAADGGVFTFGDRNFHGSLGGMRLNKPVVGGATDPSDFDGYWLVAADGGVFSFAAEFYGSLGGQSLTAPAVEIEPTPTGKGYWIVLANGKVYPFGDAKAFGDMFGKPMNRPIVGMAVTPSGQGYWLVGGDGGIFNFGDAGFHGSTGNERLNAPVIDLAPAVDNNGYYLLASDGGVFTFGSAVFKGSTGAMTLNAPVIAMLVAPNGAGYWLAATDGGVFTFGEIDFLGSMGGKALNSPVLDLIN